MLMLAANQAVFADELFKPQAGSRLDKLYHQASPFESVAEEKWVLESENAYVIEDIKPQAPVHLLVIPKQRIPTVLQASPELLAEMLTLAKKAVRLYGIEKSGFRLVINTHPEGGQGVYHLHIHILGGRMLKQPLA